MPQNFKRITPEHIPVPVDVAGSSTFGRDPKIQASRTFNMLLADGWLVDTYGYTNVLTLSQDFKGRGLFASTRGDFLVAVVGDSVVRLTPLIQMGNPLTTFASNPIGTIGSFSGDVFIAENNTNQVAFCDLSALYVYDYVADTFQIAVLPPGVIPGYVTYQNGFFIIVDRITANWYLSAPGDGLSWLWGASGTPVSGSIQTKGDLATAVIRVAGRGNLLFVMGRTVTEQWTGVPSTLFPYQRSTSTNIDYGCVNPATLASSDQITAWLGSNEKSGAVIMFSEGTDIQQISTDGWNFKFAQLKHPEDSSAFFLKISGHLLYQLTFYNAEDNFSLIYDFTTKKFFDVTDENMNYHILREVAYFEGRYYGISFNDGNIYQLEESTHVYNYGDGDIKEIPRIRVCSNIRAPNQLRFVLTNFSFTMEQGNDPDHIVPQLSYQPRVALSLSKDGGYEFSSYLRKDLRRLGVRANRLVWWQLGSMNDLVLQIRYFGEGPWRCTNGIANLWQ